MNLSIPEIVRLLDVEVRDVQRWIRTGQFTAHRVHGDYQVHRSELFDWASAHGVVLPRRFFAVRGGIDARGAFAGALRHGGVHRLPSAGDRHAVAGALIACLGGRAHEQPGVVVDIVESRVGLGFAHARDGISLPRLREPIVIAGPTAVHVCAFDAPVVLPDLQARVILLVVAPTIGEHRTMVEDLYAALDDDAFREAVLAGSAVEALVQCATALSRRHTDSR